MMKNMSLRNTVGRRLAEPSTNGAKVAEQMTIEGRERSTYKSEFRGAVVREERVRMLQERDQNQPVVHPQIRHEVNTKHVAETARVRPVRKTSDPKEETDIGDEYLEELVGLEERRSRDKI